MKTLSLQQLEILRHAAKSGEILRMTYDGGPIWIRSGNVDLGDENDRGDQALYVDALRELLEQGLVEIQRKDYYRLTGRGFTAAKRAIQIIDRKIEATQRGKLLELLYCDRNHKYSSVKPSSFSPEISKREISMMGRDFFNAQLIEDFPMDNGGNFFMRISLHGKAVWEGKEKTTLDINHSEESEEEPKSLLEQAAKTDVSTQATIASPTEVVPSSFEEIFIRLVWKSRWKWIIFIGIFFVVAILGIYSVLPETTQLKIIDFLRGTMHL